MKIKASFAETNTSIGAKLTSANETLSADFGEVQVVPGADGISPTVDIEPIDGGHRISITDINGTQTADVMDGRDGKDGADGYTPVKGVDYFDGDPGVDGISPTVAVQDITGGHRVTITDKDGAKTFDVMDGKDGAGGSGGASVQSDWSVNDENDPAYVQNRTHWVERPYEPIVWDGSIEGRDTVDAGPVLGYPAGFVFAYKLSDHVLTKDEIATSNIVATVGGKEYKGKIEEPQDLYPGAIWGSNFSCDSVVYDEITTEAQGLLVSVAIAGDFSSILGIVIPSTGTYVLHADPDKIADSFVVDGDVYHRIPDGYLPEFSDVAYTGDYEHLNNLPEIPQDAIRYGKNQFLSEQHKSTARSNIDVYGKSEVYNKTESDAAYGELEKTTEGVRSNIIAIQNNIVGMVYGGQNDRGDVFNCRNGNTYNYAPGMDSHAEGYKTHSNGDYSHSQGHATSSDGLCAHSQGFGTKAKGDYSHAQGYCTIVNADCGHVQGRINIEDADGKYAHIVGNGSGTVTSGFIFSNAHTLDWDGNAWYSGSVYVGSTSGANRDEGSRKLVANGDNEIILTSPSGTRYRLTVADDGTLTTAAV